MVRVALGDLVDVVGAELPGPDPTSGLSSKTAQAACALKSAAKKLRSLDQASGLVMLLREYGKSLSANGTDASKRAKQAIEYLSRDFRGARARNLPDSQSASKYCPDPSHSGSRNKKPNPSDRLALCHAMPREHHVNKEQEAAVQLGS